MAIMPTKEICVRGSRTVSYTHLVNGETICTNPEVSTYVEINRTWKDGDVVEIHMPVSYTHLALGSAVGCIFDRMHTCCQKKKDRQIKKLTKIIKKYNF